MSFLQALTHDRCRAEQLQSTWKSLCYDTLQQQQQQKHISVISRHPLTPPSSPESGASYQITHSSSSLTSLPATSDRFRVMEATGYTKRSHVHNSRPAVFRVPDHAQCSCCPPTFPPVLHSPVTTDSTYRFDTTVTHTTHSLDYITEARSSVEQSGSLKRKFQNVEDHFVNAKKNKSSEEEVACQVHGILSLPGCREPRYNISAEELERRVNKPECLTKVDMISYVRLAKNSARSLLDKHNIKTNQHNQRSEHSVLSKMCEAETQVLAKGIRDLNYRYFPGSWFATKSVHEITKNIPNNRQHQEALSERLKEDEITKCVLLDIYFGLEKRKHDEEMNIFNLMSHSFGVPNLQNHILFLLSYIEEELRILKKSV